MNEQDIRDSVADCKAQGMGSPFEWEVVAFLLAELDRLRAGDFTEEEFQNLCHKFSDDDALRFAKGCAEYNRKLFGGKSCAAVCLGQYPAPVHSLPEE